MGMLARRRSPCTFAGIYQITNRVTRDSYIGQSENVGARIWQHLRHLAQRRHVNRSLQKSFDQFGVVAFSFEVIETCEPRELNEREQRHVNERKPTFNRATEDIGVAAAIQTPAFDPTVFLSVRQREAFRLHRDNGMTQCEIAAKMRRSQAGVSRLLQRAKRRLVAIAAQCSPVEN